ncbi:MAG: PhaM family polyhydroxyalkanoate granule multifunctional regulatory protein [Pseudomonadota bacterium]
MTNATQNDPLEFLKSMWGNMGFTLPGMVAPTLDTDELSKRIADLKAVEGWLKSNLSLLQMTIQGLEMQRTTLTTLQQMSQAAQQASEGETPVNPFLNPAAWPMPWNLAGETGAAPQQAPAAETPAPPPAEAAPSAGKKSKPKG